MAPKSNYGFGLKSKIRAIALIPENLEYKLTLRNFMWSLSNAPSGQKRLTNCDASDKLFENAWVYYIFVNLFAEQTTCFEQILIYGEFDGNRMKLVLFSMDLLWELFLDCSFCRSVNHVWWIKVVFLQIVDIVQVFYFTISYNLLSKSL